MARRALFPFLVLLLTSIGALAQEAGERRVIPLLVLTQESNLFRGLTRSQLQVEGVKADWELTFDEGPRRILLLLDVSESMSDKDKWQRALDFTRAFIGLAAEEDELAMRIFAERYRKLVAFTRERQPLLEALDSLPHPGTRESGLTIGNHRRVKAALLLAAQEANGFGGAIVLVSDTVVADGSPTRDSQLRDTLAARAVRLMHVDVALPGRVGDFQMSGLPKSSLREIVPFTGGGYYYFWDGLAWYGSRIFFATRETLEVARRAYSHVKYVYRLNLRLRQPLVEKLRIRVSIIDKELKRQHSLYLGYPTHLYPAKSAGE